MKGYHTSYVGMFDAAPDGLEPVELVEIPKIQRDYAQGRDTPVVELIRNEFLDVLFSAITGGKRVDLDFVYGEIEDGTLRPLDGQQRLTTLFLIHWYVAARLGQLPSAQRWLQFSYATRPTAELFCRELVDPENGPDDAFDSKAPQEWIRDQAWYLYAWRHDPTVTSMLKMLDAIHARLDGPSIDLDAVWAALTTTDGEPAIGFYFLPIDDMPSGEELYIKMNSRGKTLTSWENLKPRLEKVMATSLSEEDFGRFVRRLDGVWTDVLWRLEGDGGDFLIDEEFEHYLEFIIEVSEWRDRIAAEGTLVDRAERLFTDRSSNVQRNVGFLFHAFDTWTAEGHDARMEPIDTSAVFASHFASAAELGSAVGQRVVLFEESTDVDLFKQCCRRYGLKSGKNRLFTLAQTLVLVAVLLHRQEPKDDVQRRLRVLRNLTDTANREVIEARMADLVEGVERLMSDDSIDAALAWMEGRPTFNPDRLTDEREKLRLFPVDSDLETTIFGLEDHPLLRGRVFPFDLAAEEVDHLPKRAATFATITTPEFWPLLAGALLATGDYGYRMWNLCQLGTENPRYEATWRDVLTRYGRKGNAGLRESLSALLDLIGENDGDPSGALRRVMDSFVELGEEQRQYDWRYYLLAYPVMRSAPRGMYQGEYLDSTGHWRYSMCLMMTPTGTFSGSATYKDPFLLAVREASGVKDQLIDPSFNLGSADAPRWMRTKRSETGIRCVTAGFAVEAPQDETLVSDFDAVCAEHGVVDSLLPVLQNEHDGEMVDAEDRVAKAAAFVKSLVDHGL